MIRLIIFKNPLPMIFWHHAECLIIVCKPTVCSIPLHALFLHLAKRDNTGVEFRNVSDIHEGNLLSHLCVLNDENQVIFDDEQQRFVIIVSKLCYVMLCYVMYSYACEATRA